jgi:hypothetical protein
MGDVTRILDAVARGDRPAARQLLPQVSDKSMRKASADGALHYG